MPMEFSDLLKKMASTNGKRSATEMAGTGSKATFSTDSKRVRPSSVSDKQHQQQIHQQLQQTLTKLKIASVLFSCYEGSVTHYYHFFYGAMLPLIDYHLRHPARSFRILTDIGPMKGILCELGLTIVEFRGPNFLSVSFGNGHDDKSMWVDAKPGEDKLPAYDVFNTAFYEGNFYPKPPKSMLQRCLKFFEDATPSYLSGLPVYDVLLIRRGEESYYSQGCTDRDKVYQTSGSQRRNIGNHRALADRLREEFGDEKVGDIALERMSIFYQYRLFNSAKVVIAQHGASLANLFFMMPRDGKQSSTGRVIELSPPWSREKQHFANLAHYLGIDHTLVWQETDFADINIEEVVNAAR